MDISEIVEKAGGIGNSAKFHVRLYGVDDVLYEEREMTYIQLGMFLMTHTTEIKRVDIRIRSEI